MTESIKELREICQTIKKGEGHGWYKIHRGISIYFTKLFLYTPITPNQVTFLRLILGLLGCYFIVLPTLSWNILGFIALYLSFLLDKVDGEVARYRKKTSYAGSYLDEITHIIVPALIFLGIGFNLFLQYDTVMPVFISMIPAFAITFMRANFNISYALVSKFLLFKGYHAENNGNALQEKIQLSFGFKKFIGNLFDELKEYFNFLLILIVFYLLAYFNVPQLFTIDYKYLLLIIYAIFLTLLFILQVYITYRKIDGQVASYLQEIKK